MKTRPAIILVVTAALLTSCAGGPATTEQPAFENRPTASDGELSATSMPRASTEPAHMQPPATRDPVELGKTFVAAAYTWDTRTDTDLTAALKRVDYMATDELAAQFVAPQNSSKGASGNQATRNQAHTEPKVIIVPKGNQALTKSRPETKKAAYMVTWKWVGPDGYRQDGGKDLVILTLEETEQGWKVASFEPTTLK